MEELKSKKMAEMPITKLIFNMSLPAILSMLVQALYNVVDSMYLARYSTPALEAAGMATAALDAVSIAFPLQTLIIAFSIGVGVGTNAFLSRLLGAKMNEEASEVARTGIVMAIVIAAVFVALGAFLSRPFMRMFTSEQVVQDMGTSYLTVVLCVSVFAFSEITLNKILQATGNMIVPMFSQLAGALTNIVLDPFLIFGMWIFPEMGITGAAVATVTGQAVAFLVSLSAFVFRKQDVSLNLKGFRFRSKYVLGILKIGLPAMVMNAIMSVTTALMNLIIKGYKYAITVLGIYFKAESFVFMPVFGLMQGALPVMSYNYGANNADRFKKAFKVTLVIACSFMTAGLVLFMFFPGVIMGAFNASGEMADVGVMALRLIALCFIPAAVGITVSTGYQALNNGFAALMMSLTRQLILLIPLAFVLERIFGLYGAFASYCIAEFISVGLFTPLFIKSRKQAFILKTE